jgi:hypothetical protein
VWNRNQFAGLARQEHPMRALLLAVTAIGTLSAIDIAPADAYDNGFRHDYGFPVCMRTRYDTDDCNYYNFQQCQFTASGLGTTCFANPAYAYTEPAYVDEPAPRRRHRRHY